ncbi:MAG: hypothetical protein ISQ52_00315 [Synechococcus sp. BS307-5m-G38]|nr:hypothetical protein [Synechococcus sp. BS307-5m-G38]
MQSLWGWPSMLALLVLVIWLVSISVRLSSRLRGVSPDEHHLADEE